MQPVTTARSCVLRQHDLQEHASHEERVGDRLRMSCVAARASLCIQLVPRSQESETDFLPRICKIQYLSWAHLSVPTCPRRVLQILNKLTVDAEAIDGVPEPAVRAKHDAHVSLHQCTEVVHGVSNVSNTCNAPCANTTFTPPRRRLEP